jgi:hypothetical protein
MAHAHLYTQVADLKHQLDELDQQYAGLLKIAAII